MGRDKAFVELGDPPQLLWKRQLDLLSSLGAEQIMISHNADQSFEVTSNVELVADKISDSGPLGGLVSCLQRSRYERLLLLAVDLPFMNAAFIERLLALGTGVVLRDPDNHRYEPVAAIYTRACLPIAERHLNDGVLSMQRLIDACVAAGEVGVLELEPHELQFLKNLNTPEDLS